MQLPLLSTHFAAQREWGLNLHVNVVSVLNTAIPEGKEDGLVASAEILEFGRLNPEDISLMSETAIPSETVEFRLFKLPDINPETESNPITSLDQLLKQATKTPPVREAQKVYIKVGDFLKEESKRQVETLLKSLYEVSKQTYSV